MTEQTVNDAYAAGKTDDPYIGHSAGGSMAVAYLRRTSEWVLVDLWTELGQFGLYGIPGNADREVRAFGGSPLYLATDEWCGMDECSDQLAVISLDAAQPRFLGIVEAGAIYPVDAGDPTSTVDCEYYRYTAEVGPPQGQARCQPSS